ncbi:hypothetical protein HDV05_005530 [Chytridiales sp. JEL 0842]|nr:hypothetical protein HDV05_005530 [Chytridiales sp. JEL 0842]
MIHLQQLPPSLLLLPFLISTTTVQLQPPSYKYTPLGCYISTFLPNSASTYILRDFYTTDRFLTTSRCAQLAISRNLQYFGTQTGGDCFAGNVTYLLNEINDDQKCTFRCEGNQTQVCGDHWTMSVYSRAASEFSPFPGYQALVDKTPLPVGVERSVGDFSYVGCINNNRERVLRMGLRSENIDLTMTLEKCRDIAFQNGARHFGIELGSQCFYGNEIFWPEERKVVDIDCDRPCEGAPNETCGANFRMNLYRIDYQSASASNAAAAVFSTSGLSTVAIASIAVGVIFASLAVGGAAVLLRRRRPSDNKDSSSANDTPSTTPPEPVTDTSSSHVTLPSADTSQPAAIELQNLHHVDPQNPVMAGAYPQHTHHPNSTENASSSSSSSQVPLLPLSFDLAKPSGSIEIFDVGDVPDNKKVEVTETRMVVVTTAMQPAAVQEFHVELEEPPPPSYADVV